MKEKIYYIDRQSGSKQEELVYGGSFLEMLYGTSWQARLLGSWLSFLICHFPFFSTCYGFFQKRPRSKKKIAPFISKYQINTTEFVEKPEHFSSFNDFFCRSLKKESRPINPQPGTAIIPADGRFLFFQRIDEIKNFIIKNASFDLQSFVKNKDYVDRYHNGTLIIGRLCPTDYHRFHFPCDCTPTQPQLINGPLYSVNPIAIRQNIKILSENKRMITELNTIEFGTVLFIEIGATSVGTIHQTFIPYQKHAKGDEKGFFSFGGSAIAMIFQANTIELDQDLITLSNRNLEIYCQMGQSMGKSKLIF